MAALVGSKRTATLFAWLVLLVFCSVILTGWWYFFTPTIGHQAPAFLAALALTLLAAFCARQIAQLRADAALSGAPRKWYLGWKPYLFLVLISALGTLNAAFYLFEGRTILRHDIATVRDSYTALRNDAAKRAPPPGYIERAAFVDGQLKNLHEEIVSPVGGAYCGVGSYARGIIKTIRGQLPEYHVLNGTGPINPCDVAKAEAVYRSYEQMAHEQLRQDTRTATNGPARLAFLDDLQNHYREMDKTLGALEDSAGGVGGTATLAVNALRLARDGYNDDRNRYYSLLGETPGELPALSSLQTEDLNNYAKLPELVVKRLFHPETLVYLAVAFALDFGLIYLLTHLNTHYGRRKSAGKGQEPDARFQTDPRFLWVNAQ